MLLAGADKKIGELSSGNKRKPLEAALASALSCIYTTSPQRARPADARTLFDALLRDRQKGATVFLSSHNLDEVDRSCSRVAIIREGSIADRKEVSEFPPRAQKEQLKAAARKHGARAKR
jgi:ABC-2 type transport system ATP-binding protein